MISNSKRLFRILVVLSLTFIFSGCDFYDVPSSLISSPKLSANEDFEDIDSVDIDKLRILVQKFMPKGGKLLEESKTSGKKNILSIDVDGDLNNELIVLFKDDSNFKKGFFVLKENSGEWVKIYERSLEGNSISTLKTLTVKNKEDKRLLVGYLISGNAGTDFYLYDFKDDNVKEVSMGRWNRMEIINTPDKDEDKNLVFGAQVNEFNKDYSSYVIGFDGEKFYAAEDFYDDYYTKNVEYYKGELIQEMNNELIWYYYIESQIKSKQYTKALESLNEVFKSKEDKNGEPTIQVGYYKFLILKAEALNGLGEYSQATDILNKIKNIGSLNDNDYFYNEPKEYSTIDIYYELGVAYKGLGDKVKSEKCFKYAIEEFEKLSLDDSFSENPTSNILKQVIYYPLTKEINNK